jgi:hypothetical protein
MLLRTFGGALLVAVVGLTLGFLYGGGTALAVTAILAVLEVSLSFDNAVVNATVLVRMNPFWQKMFLTVGVAIAVFGMRLVFPLLVVGITAKLSPVQAVRLALQKGDPDKKGTYGYLLHQAHPAIAAFGGVFLLLLFLDFVFEERELTWLSWLERPLARIGKLDQLSVVVTLGVLAIAGYWLAPAHKIETVFAAGIFGIITYLLVNGLGSFFDTEEEDEAGARRTAHVVGKAAFFLFLYLEVLDASFSFDGVVGAFAITSDPIIIAIGLGIGAMFIRSLTVLLVRKGTLSEYVYLEHGALWAIGALAIVLLLTMRWDVPEVVTGLIGVAFIGTAFLSSVIRNRRNPEDSADPAGSDREPAAL